MYNVLQTKNSKAFFVVTLIVSFFPFAFANIRSIENFLWIEALAPISIAFISIKLLINKKIFFPSGGRLIAISMLVLGFWALIHYISNPLFSTTISGNTIGSGFRRYYEIFTGLCLFFYFYWASFYYTEEKQIWNQLITIVMLLALIAGYTRVITYFFNMKMPLMQGHFDYAGHEMSSGAYRIGGLTEMATTGISALIAIYYNKPWTKYFYFLLSLFMLLLVLSGGRTACFAVITVFFAYGLFFEKEKIKNILFMYIMFSLIILILNLKFDLFMDQFSRLTAIQGGFSESSPQRYSLYKEMWKIFLHHPFTGKGIGARYISSLNLSDFNYENLIDGGHGSYLSIIMLFGIGGAFFLSNALFGSIFKAYSYLKKIRQLKKFEDECIVISFCLISLCMLSILFISEGSGYNNLILYVSAGVIAGRFALNVIYRNLAR